jgi:soluble lytic murein transglycosylase-like protein
MKLIYISLTSTLIYAVSSNSFADVLVDLDNQSEVAISNTEQLSHYTLKIEEPIAQRSDFLPTEKISKLINIRNFPYHNEVVLASQATSIEPALIHAIITVESKHNALATSRKGAFGLMQLMPETASRFKVTNKNDPQQNILAGAKYMKELLTKYNGDLNLSLAAYNAGPAAVQKYGGKIPPYYETINYVPKVLKYYREYS